MSWKSSKELSSDFSLRKRASELLSTRKELILRNNNSLPVQILFEKVTQHLLPQNFDHMKTLLMEALEKTSKCFAEISLNPSEMLCDLCQRDNGKDVLLFLCLEFPVSFYPPLSTNKAIIPYLYWSLDLLHHLETYGNYDIILFLTQYFGKHFVFLNSL